MSHDFQIAMSKNVLAISYSDSWMAHPDLNSLIDKVNSHVARFEGRPWALFDDIRNWPVKGPAHIKTCANAVEDLADLGLTDCVVCADGLAISHWMMKKIIPETVRSVFFETPPEARTWLIEHNYDASALDDIKTDS